MLTKIYLYICYSLNIYAKCVTIEEINMNMKTKEIPENPFTGEFAVLGYDSYDEEKGWIVGRRDEFDGICEWRFEQTGVQELPSGTVAYSGRFSNFFKSYPPKISAYIYYPAEQTLCIIHFECSGEYNIHRDWYGAEKISDNEFWIYVLKDKGTEDYQIRMKIKKIY